MCSSFFGVDTTHTTIVLKKGMASHLYLLPDELLAAVSACLTRRSGYCLFEDDARALRCACVWTRDVLPKPAHTCESLIEVVSSLKTMTLSHPQFDRMPLLKQRYRCAPAEHEPYMLIDTRVLLKAHNMCVTCYCRDHAAARETFERMDDLVEQASRVRFPSIQLASWEQFKELRMAMYWSRLCFKKRRPVATPVVPGNIRFTWVDKVPDFVPRDINI